jgi:hypothetical protein
MTHSPCRERGNPNRCPSAGATSRQPTSRRTNRTSARLNRSARPPISRQKSQPEPQAAVPTDSPPPRRQQQRSTANRDHLHPHLHRHHRANTVPRRGRHPPRVPTLREPRRHSRRLHPTPHGQPRQLRPSDQRRPGRRPRGSSPAESSTSSISSLTTTSTEPPKTPAPRARTYHKSHCSLDLPCATHPPASLNIRFTLCVP